VEVRVWGKCGESNGTIYWILTLKELVVSFWAP